ncbi:glycosyltransferase family 4 protein [Neomoorella mulderi]|uniref:Alpha-D-kanosaminyltransferase n=1 Tax=Moorella mulderi DSM 14980 TaxID=1122241 RepID=A0A151AZ43_9FIRM|nr:glycosyltransferase family 4 protein [Moorella mulderi]KYH32823.1 alpha-D-kanosaminyltransferase [Moorella mulderi DSM 14980]
MKKFLIWTQYYVPEIGATAIRLHSVARELVRQGYHVCVVTGMPNYPKGQIYPAYRGKFYCCEQIDGVRVHRCWFHPAREVGLGRIFSYLYFIVSTFPVFILLARKVDLIIAEVPPPTVSFGARIALPFSGAKLIVNVSDLWPDWLLSSGLLKPGMVSRLLKLINSFTFSKADFVNGVTQGIINDIKQNYGIPEDKLLFLPNGVDTTLFSYQGPSIRKGGIDEGQKLFVYAGNHGIYNWPIVIAQAAARLQRRRNDIKFLLVGDGSQKREVVAFCLEHNLTNIEFKAPVPIEEVASLYGKAYAAISTYKKGFLSRPAKIFPAMACGLPLVYSGEGEGANIVKNAACGIVVPPEDPDELARAVERLADDYEMAKNLGNNGFNLVQREYSWSSIVKSWLADLEAKLISK